jgi:hypothetical protein
MKVSTMASRMPRQDDDGPMSIEGRLRQLGAMPFRWDSTAEERQQPFPADRFLTEPDDTLFRALTVTAPAPLVFRWLCQLRAAPYSYDWLDNAGRQSPRRLTPGLDQLAHGQRIMYIFRLVDFTRDEHLTVTLSGGWAALFGEAAITYRVVETTAETSRIVVKLAIRYPFWGRWRAVRWLFALGDLVMMRKQLRTLGALAKQMARRAELVDTARPAD